MTSDSIPQDGLARNRPSYGPPREVAWAGPAQVVALVVLLTAPGLLVATGPISAGRADPLGVLAPVAVPNPAVSTGGEPHSMPISFAGGFPADPGSWASQAALRRTVPLPSELPSVDYARFGSWIPAPPDATPGTAVLPRGATSPPDLNVSGNTTLVVSSDTTVGNISLQDNATLYVHSLTIRPTLTVLGNIRLNGHALLFVNSSNLAIGESYDVEWTILLADTSRFVSVYSNVTTNGYQWGAAFEGLSNVTILYSLIGYPTGWLDTSLIGAATLAVEFSWYSSDVIMFDNAVAPSIAQFVAGESAGFNIWLNFKAGASANLSLPGLTGWRNWTFPGTAQVSEVNYTVAIYHCYVLVFAVMLWQGANLTLVDSPDIALSLNIEFGTVDLNGLAEAHYDAFALASGLFLLQLWNTTMFTWNVYGFNGNARITNSEVGEIQDFGASWTSVHDSNLTAHGGYYGNQGTSSLAIFDSQLEGQLVGYSGVTLLENSTVDTPAPSRILATGSGVVYALDDTLAVQDDYESLGQGIVELAWGVHVNVTSLGGPASGAQVDLRWTSNGTTATGGATDSVGGWSGALIGSWIQGSTTTPETYNATATYLNAASSWGIASRTTPAWYSTDLSPLLASTAPTDGSIGVSIHLAAITVDFTAPMSTVPTADGASVAPAISYVASWDPSGRNLTLTPSVALAWNTTYVVTLGTGTGSTGGVSLVTPILFSFTTESNSSTPVTPYVALTSPVNGSLNVSNRTTVSVTFSIAMNATTLVSAFSISPGSAALGSTYVNATRIIWTSVGPLENNTTYTVTVSTGATSQSGVPLPRPYVFSFRTAENATTVPQPPGNVDGTSSASPAAPAWALWGALGAIGLLVAVVVAYFLSRRGSGGRPAPPPAPTSAPSAATPPAWSESEPGSPPAR